jgi:uncharacterized protein
VVESAFERTFMKISRPHLGLPLLAVAAFAGIMYTRPAAEPAIKDEPRTEHRDLSDSNHDGTPDFLLLSGADSDAFRGWFTFLAESTHYMAQVPTEIDDCAALLRFAFRESLRAHDGEWASRLNLPLPPALPAIQKYRYPFTPLSANLFRIREGAFAESDLTDGTFNQFADAETLRRYNTHFISKDIRAARPGDLLFYLQAEQEMPHHAMIFLGAGTFEPDSSEWIIYHTGPIGNDKGEIRRRSTVELLNHREPRWHPVPSNGGFLGVYRWNILQ